MTVPHLDWPPIGSFPTQNPEGLDADLRFYVYSGSWSIYIVFLQLKKIRMRFNPSDDSCIHKACKYLFDIYIYCTMSVTSGPSHIFIARGIQPGSLDPINSYTYSYIA